MLYKDTDTEHPYYYPYAPVPAPEAPVNQVPVSARGAALDDTPQPPQAPRKQRQSGWRAGAIIALALVMLLVFGVGLFSGVVLLNKHTSASTTTASTTTATPISQTQQEAAIAKVEPAVVELQVTTNQGEAIGSGVIIDTNGDIVTNNHVVKGAQSMQVLLSDGTTEKAQLVGTNAANDLYVVRIAQFAHMTVSGL